MRLFHMYLYDYFSFDLILNESSLLAYALCWIQYNMQVELIKEHNNMYFEPTWIFIILRFITSNNGFWLVRFCKYDENLLEPLDLDFLIDATMWNNKRVFIKYRNLHALINLNIISHYSSLGSLFIYREILHGPVLVEVLFFKWTIFGYSHEMNTRFSTSQLTHFQFE